MPGRRRAIRLVQRFAACFSDHHAPDLIEHDKQAALSLARHIGMFVDRRGHVSLEKRIALMTPEERCARVFEVLERELQFLSPDELEQFKEIENQIEAEY
jgi:hypothetical protein